MVVFFRVMIFWSETVWAFYTLVILSLFKGTIPLLKLYFHALKSNSFIFLDEFIQECKDFMETLSLTRSLKQKITKKRNSEILCND